MPKSKKTAKSCRLCKATGSETFRYMREKYIFDVELARKIVADGRTPVELDEDDVRFSLSKCEVDEVHATHVDTSFPGIIAVVFAQNDGEQVQGHRLIDGHHRAARCLSLGIPYRAYLLSEQESVQILLKSPFEPELAEQ